MSDFNCKKCLHQIDPPTDDDLIHDTWVCEECNEHQDSDYIKTSLLIDSLGRISKLETKLDQVARILSKLTGVK